MEIRNVGCFINFGVNFLNLGGYLDIFLFKRGSRNLFFRFFVGKVCKDSVSCCKFYLLCDCYFCFCILEF